MNSQSDIRSVSNPPSPNWGFNGHIIDHSSDRNLRSRSRNSHTPTNRRNANVIAGNANNSSINSERYNMPRFRRSPSARRCCLYARNSPPLIQNLQNLQNQSTCQSNIGNFSSLLGSAPIPPTFLFDGSDSFNGHRIHHSSPQPSQASNTNISNAVYSQLLNASHSNSVDSHSGSHSYRPHINTPPNIASQSVCMCCFHQIRIASPQVLSFNFDVSVVNFVDMTNRLINRLINFVLINRCLLQAMVNRLPLCSAEQQILDSTI